MNSSSDARLVRALDSLEGLSVGDAFGEQFFMSFEMAARLLEKENEWQGPPYAFEDDFVLRELIDVRRLEFMAATWKWTDDTALALEIVAELRQHGRIEPDSLAIRFCERFLHEPNRGYGGAMHSLLPRLAREPWRESACNLFNGQGSFGNGSAMRVPPLGAYFADDFDLLVEQARLSAIVTHAHEEGVAGAIATAVAAGVCARLKEEGGELEPAQFLEEVIARTPDSLVKTRLLEVQAFDDSYTSEQVADIVGSGSEVACQDTVPFCVWCAATESRFFSEAMWLTVAGLGDRDTTCAIVGGIVGAKVGKREIPAEWRARREPLPQV
jgi:ADP-ribosylglycohydrolase